MVKKVSFLKKPFVRKFGIPILFALGITINAIVLKFLV